MRCALILCGLFIACSGCARYEYDLVEPADLACHIGRGEETAVRLGDVDYRLVSYDNRLVIRIINPTDLALELLGEESFVVDPHGESRPLRGVTIAPDSFAKVIFPPLREYVYDPGPRLGIGFGIGISSAVGRRGAVGSGLGGGVYDSPRYLGVRDDGRYHWDWDGESSVRVRFSYRFRDEQRTFHHDLVFRRVKAG